jgi:hypothetical protein
MTARLGVRMVMAVALASATSCSSSRDPITPDAPRPVDATPPPDTTPQPQPLTACEAQVEPIDLALTETFQQAGDFFASAFYFRTKTGIQRRRLGGTVQTLVADGQPYPRLGAAATLNVRGSGAAFELERPRGGVDCDTPALIPVSLNYKTNPGLAVAGEVVVLVDDLTGDVTHVLARGDMYDGEKVDKVTVVSSYGTCGRAILRVQLASGRTLMVVRDPQSKQLQTVLTVAKPGANQGGQPIEGTTDRFHGFWVYSDMEADQVTFLSTVDNAANQQVGRFLGSLDLSSGKITCRITDTDIPCVTQRPVNNIPSGWAQRGDTAAAVDTALTVVHGSSVERQIDGGFGVLVCKSTGDVYFPRQFEQPQLQTYANEVYVLRRSGQIERVTRNIELALAHGTYATTFDGYRLTEGCDVVQNARTPGPNSESQLVIYWTDGAFATLPIDWRFSVVGHEESNSVAMLNYTGEAAMIHPPSGNCKVPADVFPAATR